MTDVVVNRVSQSGIITLDLSVFMPSVVSLDMADFLYRGLILKEKEFRAQVKEKNWAEYTDKYVAVCCSADAIVPVWAYMLLVLSLRPYTDKVVLSDKEAAVIAFACADIERLGLADFQDKRVVIKGCGEKKIADALFVAISMRLQPVVKSLMYGEPCSTVPLYKKK